LLKSTGEKHKRRRKKLKKKTKFRRGKGSGGTVKMLPGHIMNNSMGACQKRKVVKAYKNKPEGGS